MQITKEDGIAQLAKWYDSKTKVDAIYRSNSTRVEVIGIIEELSSSGLKVVGPGAEIGISFHETANYEYEDLQVPNVERKERANKYPIFIKVAFGGGDHLEISEYCQE